MIKKNLNSDANGQTADTTKILNVNDAPATRRTGNGKGRTDKETQAKNAEKARKTGI